jgi:capsular polysaccharide transport system permease protein
MASPSREILTSDGAGLPSSSSSFRERAQTLAAKRPFVSYMLVVMLLSGLYYGAISARLFVSESRFAIRSKEVAAPTGLLAGLMGPPSGLTDITAVSDYIRSPDMLRILEQRHKLRQLYAQPRLDLLQWLPQGASEEDFLAFYRRHVIVKLDREANTVIVQVRSFNPESSLNVADSVIELTGEFVDGMSQKMRSETLKSAKAELEQANRVADSARRKVASFRAAGSDLDPTQSGAAVVGGVAAMEASAAQTRAELASLMTYSQPNAPVVRQLQARLSAINSQIASLRAQQSNSAPLSKQVTDFETVQLERANAERTLALAQTAFDQARATAEQREKYVVNIVNPNRPQAPTYPNRVLEFITILIFAMAGYALVSLSIAAVRDHRGV